MGTTSKKNNNLFAVLVLGLLVPLLALACGNSKSQPTKDAGGSDNPEMDGGTTDDTDGDTGSDTADTESQSEESEADGGIDTDSMDATDSQIDSGTSDTESGSETESSSETESGGDTESNSDTENTGDSESNSDTESTVDTQSDGDQPEVDGGMDAGMDSDTASDTESEPEEVTLSGACDPADNIGRFVAEGQEIFGIVEGSVADGVVPVTILQPVLEEGDCALMMRENPFCDPACDSQQTCDFDGQCIPSPRNQDVGVVEIDGLVHPVSMEPKAPGNNYFDTTLPNPPFVENNLVELRLTDGYAGAMSLYGYGVADLEVTDSQWTIEGGKPLLIRWDGSGDIEKNRIKLKLSIDQHGATPVSLICDFEDDGEAEISSNVIDTLLSYPISGFPNGGLSRQTADAETIDEGCIDFLVASSRIVKIRVAGIIPCDVQSQCPTGKTCNLINHLCE